MSPSMSRLGGSYFLLQNGIYDLDAFRSTLLFGNFEGFGVRGSKADVSGCFRVRLGIVAAEYFILPYHFVRLREGRVLRLGFLQSV